MESPRVLTWLPRRGFTHHDLDNGESNSYNNASPVLGGALPADLAAISALFLTADAGLPDEIRRFVRDKLEAG